jgi:hypothetical protein
MNSMTGSEEKGSDERGPEAADMSGLQREVIFKVKKTSEAIPEIHEIWEDCYGSDTVKSMGWEIISRLHPALLFLSYPFLFAD